MAQRLRINLGFSVNPVHFYLALSGFLYRLIFVHLFFRWVFFNLLLITLTLSSLYLLPYLRSVMRPFALLDVLQVDHTHLHFGIQYIMMFWQSFLVRLVWRINYFLCIWYSNRVGFLLTWVSTEFMCLYAIWKYWAQSIQLQ